MSQLKLPGDDGQKKKGITVNRVAIWVIVGGVGLYLLISGVIGIVVKAS